ncbi:MAG: hypothetical protein AAF462_03940 [Thermodesulfobacteriota bacterium]
MKISYNLIFAIVLVLVLSVSCDENNNMMSDPGSSTPKLECEALALNINFNIGPDVFAVYENSSSKNIIHVYSNGAKVFIILSNDDFAFGFSGDASMDGLTCSLDVALADFDKDGMFDETATTFNSSCAVEANGFVFTLFPNEAEINASTQMENAFQSFESTEMDIPCEEFQVIENQTFFEGLIKELGYVPTN